MYKGKTVIAALVLSLVETPASFAQPFLAQPPLVCVMKVHGTTFDGDLKQARIYNNGAVAPCPKGRRCFFQKGDYVGVNAAPQGALVQQIWLRQQEFRIINGRATPVGNKWIWVPIKQPVYVSKRDLEGYPPPKERCL